jgi:hypothetical protein
MASRPRRTKPAAAPAGYSDTPLPQKLGIKPGHVVGLIGAPRDIQKMLGELPPNARFRTNPTPGRKCDVVLCFAMSKEQLAKRMQTAVAVSADTGLWLIWPKKSSGVETDLSEDVVRTHGLANGWVDFKVCAVDATWSGHKFARRERIDTSQP